MTERRFVLREDVLQHERPEPRGADEEGLDAVRVDRG